MSHNSAVEMFRRMGCGPSPGNAFLTIIMTGLVAIAGYFWFVVDNLKVPITQGLPEIATFLPVANYVAIKYLTRPPNGQPRSIPTWSLNAGIIAILLVIFDTFVVTQSINNMPMSSISCPLERTWHNYFINKDAHSIKAIQDALNCCGLKTTKEQAWPFAHEAKDPAKTIPATACSTTFKRDNACFVPWSKKHQLSASMFMTVAVVTLLSKAVIFAIYRRRVRKAPSTQRLIGPGTNNGAKNGGESSASRIAGLRLRPDERTRPLQNEDSDDAESVANETSRLLEDTEEGNQYDTSRLLEEGGSSILPSGDDVVWQGEHSRTRPSR